MLLTSTSDGEYRILLSACMYGPDDQYDDRLTTDDVSLAVLPMSHQWGIMCAICHGLTLGHQVVVMSHFNANEYVRLISKYKVY